MKKIISLINMIVIISNLMLPAFAFAEELDPVITVTESGSTHMDSTEINHPAPEETIENADLAEPDNLDSGSVVSESSSLPEQDVPEQDVPEQDVPEQDVPEQDVPEQDVLEQGGEEAAPEEIEIIGVGLNKRWLVSEDTEKVIVKFHDGTSTRSESKINDVCSVEEAEKIDTDIYVVEPENGVSLEMVVDEYEKFNSVEYAEPDYATQMLFVPNDTYYADYQASVFDAMSITDGWDEAYGDADVTIAILDTGIYFNHSDLKGKILPYGRDFVNDDDDPSDDNGHGTLCAGVVGASINNSLGIAGAANCSILPIKVLDAAGNGYVSDIAEGIIYAVDHGADVISMSLGCGSDAQTLQDAVNYAHAAGVIVIAASGNSNSSIMYPAAYGNAVAVGAINTSGNKASYSCYGSDLDLMAVGSNILSTYLSDGADSYAIASGTSMACPYVSALAALILSAQPSLDPDEILNIMETSATDLGTDGFDIYYGHGCVNYRNALLAAEIYDGSADTSSPNLILLGEAAVSMAYGSTYTDEGAVAYDAEDGDLTAAIIVDNPVDTWVAGTYTIKYSVADYSGNSASAVRTVTVRENTKPVIRLNGNQTIILAKGKTYADLGAAVIDAEEGDITQKLVISGSVTAAQTGKYTIRYNATDSHGLAADTVTRTVIVQKNTKPAITLVGKSKQTLMFGAVYMEAGATANDREDGDISSHIVTSGAVNTLKAGTYKLTYKVTDSSGASATQVRTVVVKKNTPPKITLMGQAKLTVNHYGIYNEMGAAATDAEDGILTLKMVIISTVDTQKAAKYQVLYTVTDSAGAKTTAIRTVIVK